MPVKPATDGHHAAIPTLIVHEATAAIAFYIEAFGATETSRLTYPDGRTGHAEIDIRGALVMLADEHPDHGFLGPRSLGGSPVVLTLHVDDPDAHFARAVAAGATMRSPVENQFYGDRSGQVEDPFGHVWTLATRIEDLSNEEMTRRFDACLAEQRN